MVKQHLPMRFRELIGLEEVAWLISGLVFGYLAAKGAPMFLILLPVAIFVVWLLDWLFGCRADHPKQHKLITRRQPIRR